MVESDWSKVLQISTLARLASDGDVVLEKIIISEIVNCVLDKDASITSEKAIEVFRAIDYNCNVFVAEELINMYGL